MASGDDRASVGGKRSSRTRAPHSSIVTRYGTFVGFILERNSQAHLELLPEVSQRNMHDSSECKEVA